MADEIKFFDVLRKYLSQAGGFAVEGYDGTIRLISYDDPGAPGRTLEDSEVVLDGGGNAKCTYSYTPVSKTITGIYIRYKKILPSRNDAYAETKYCLRTTTTIDLSDVGTKRHNFLTEGTLYANYLEESYERRNEDNIYRVDTDAIRDETTAENLAKLLIKLLYKPLVMITVTCSYSALDIEIGDKIGTNLTCIPTAFNSYTWIVTGMRITPHVKRSPVVRLTLLELGTTTAALPDIEQWTDSNSGAIKTDDNTGLVYQEVG